VVDALADFHAVWWEHPALGSGVARVHDWFRDAAAHARHTERRRRELDRFLEGEPRSEFRDLYAEALAVLERLWAPAWEERLATRRHLTLVNGDAYLNQFLVPREADGPAVLLDFGDATAAPGAWDLAFLMATFWTKKQRREEDRERELLFRYHRRATSAGATQSLDELLADYRRMIAYVVFDPVWNCADGSSREYWEPKMQCVTAAWRDWDCALLGASTPPS
jgi:Ser/Thr protein kinase RdoA (MazF antagonist)